MKHAFSIISRNPWMKVWNEKTTICFTFKMRKSFVVWNSEAVKTLTSLCIHVVRWASYLFRSVIYESFDQPIHLQGLISAWKHFFKHLSVCVHAWADICPHFSYILWGTFSHNLAHQNMLCGYQGFQRLNFWMKMSEVCAYCFNDKRVTCQS